MRTRSRSRRATAALVAAVLVAASACAGDDGGDASPEPEPLVYVALGDSFSSGEGAPPYDADSGACRRTPRGWARLLAEDLPTIVSLDHRACSGARAPHLTGPWEGRELPAQIPDTPDRAVTLVTLTIGGNDVGFGDIVGRCFVLSCASVPTDPGFLGAVNQLRADLTTTVYPAIAAAYPNARIAHVGYPRLTPADGEPVRGCAWLSGGDQRAAEQMVTILDTAIEAAAQDTPGVTYVDTTDALEGHELCSGDSWLNPVRIGGESAAHPTAEGQRALADAVAEALDLEPTPE